MPGMNGTGPRGEGTRTGRGMGRCRPPKSKDDKAGAPNDTGETGEENVEFEPGNRPGQGRGRGMGRGRGRGRGMGMRRGFGGGRN